MGPQKSLLLIKINTEYLFHVWSQENVLNGGLSNCFPQSKTVEVVGKRDENKRIKIVMHRISAERVGIPILHTVWN